MSRVNLDSRINMPKYLSTDQVTDRLGITAATLYSYVSRGLIRSEETGDDHRTRRYHSEDVERLYKRKAQRRDPARAAQDALDWGDPVLDSSLTAITDHTLYYRGEDATRLAQTQTFEQVAALLWTGNAADAERLFGKGAGGEVLSPTHTHLAAMQVALALAAEQDLQAHDLQAEAVARTGARIVRLLAHTCAGDGGAGGCAEQLARAWGTRHVGLLNAALVLCADHELNASSFTARVIASARGTPYAVVAGALAALSGHRHGGHVQRVAALLDEIDQYGDVNAVIRARLERGDGIPGFGHPLYPDGDPRACALLAMTREVLGETANVYDATGAAIRSATGKAPTLDYALVAVARGLGLPHHAPFALFALGRTAGWIAHAIEQYADAALMRPRARYVGKPPH
jgi:citrate synthase